MSDWEQIGKGKGSIETSAGEISIEGASVFVAPADEWQPGKILPLQHTLKFHKKTYTSDPYRCAIVRVRHVALVEMPTSFILHMQDVGCDAQTLFEIHPDDVKRFIPEYSGRVFGCEHSISVD